MANEVRRLKNKGEIPPVFPNGWFVLCESDDVKAGQVRAINALGTQSVLLHIISKKKVVNFFPSNPCMLVLGENFVVFRSEDGVVSILDAYCPHLGAHLGVGGRVVGNLVKRF